MSRQILPDGWVVVTLGYAGTFDIKIVDGGTEGISFGNEHLFRAMPEATARELIALKAELVEKWYHAVDTVSRGFDRQLALAEPRLCAPEPVRTR